MARLAIKTKTLKHLFALTGNQCAFPCCEHELFVDDLFVAQVCHIFPANEKWPRFNPNRTDEENRDFSNLLVLCYKHHKLVDNPDKPFTSNKMLEIKLTHEKKFLNSPVLLNIKKIENIQKQVESYWADIVDIVKVENDKHGMARPIDPALTVWDMLELLEINLEKLNGIISDADDLLSLLDETVLPFLQKKGFSPSSKCPIKIFELGYGFNHINWETRVIGGGNFHGEAVYTLLQLKLRLAEQQSLASPDDDEAQKMLHKFRAELENAAGSTVYYD